MASWAVDTDLIFKQALIKFKGEKNHAPCKAVTKEDKGSSHSFIKTKDVPDCEASQLLLNPVSSEH